MIPEPTGTVLINHAGYAYERPAGIRIEISEYALTIRFACSIKEMPFREYRWTLAERTVQRG